jgi:hypothetical protein
LAFSVYVRAKGFGPLCWIAAAGAILTAVALSNAFSEISDYGHLGDHLPEWEPFVWEFSSVMLVAALIPAIVWLTRRVPITTHNWYRSIAIHLIATLPFSIIHVSGMVALRKLAYAAVGSNYVFGPVLSSLVYEYRKDIVTYWIIVYVYAVSAWIYRSRMKAEAEAETESAATQDSTEPPDVSDKLDRLVVRKLNREYILNVTEIARVESNGNYVTVHAGGSGYQLRSSLTGLSKRLDTRRFVQVHRFQVVNIDHIREIQPWDHGDYRILLDDGSVINFSRRYRARLEQLLNHPVEGHPERSARP